YYYEALPDPAAGDANLQTRVFRKCFQWYWKNVHPADGSKPKMKDDPAGDDEKPPRGSSVIDVDALDDPWLHDLEDRVRKALFVPEAGKPGDPADLRNSIRLVFNGEHVFHDQETQLGDKAFKVDWTHLRSDGPYAEQTNFMVAPLSDGDPYFKSRVEDIFFGRNPALGSVPIVVKLETQLADGTFAPGPSSGCNVLFQLIPVDDGNGPPSYLESRRLREITRIQKGRGAFGKGPNKVAGPRGYLEAVHEHFGRKVAPDADPTWWNAPRTQGGKGADKGIVGPPTSDGALLAVGATPADVGARGPGFNWAALDATKLTDDPVARAVSVPVLNGAAGLVFRPSRRAGDAYRIRVLVDGMQDDGKLDGVGLTTGPLTTWRRVRVTRHFKKPAPAAWKQVGSGAQFTAKDATQSGSPGIAVIDEAAGDLDDIEWKRVADNFSRAFHILEPPPKTTVLDQPTLDKAVTAAFKHVKRIITKDGTAPIDWGILVRRTAFAPDVFKTQGVQPPPYDPENLFTTGTDTPFIINYRGPDEHDQVATSPKAGVYPYNHYFDILRLLNDGNLGGFVSLFLDDFDPNDASFDPVPVPGITALQTIASDNVTYARGYQAIRTLGMLSTSMNPAQDSTDLKALDDPIIVGTDQFTWSALQPGDKLSFLRYRPGYVETELAKLDPPAEPAPGKPDPPDKAVQKHVFSPWPDKRIDFVYGASNDGTTLASLITKVQGDLGKLCRTNEIVLEPKHPGVPPPPAPGDPPPDPASFTQWLYFKHRVLSNPWPQDGLMIALELHRGDKRLGAFFLSGDSSASRQPDTPMGTSGYGQTTRTLLIHYGHDTYANQNFRGADPSGGKGRGYLRPGHLFPYDLATNASHEIGHLLYLDHQWTSDDEPATLIRNHDFDDFCVMGYLTGFVETDKGIDRSAPREKIQAGEQRDKGRADFCGRCLLALRGWSLQRAEIPPNVPTEKAAGAATPTGAGDDPNWPGVGNYIGKSGHPNQGISIIGTRDFYDKTVAALSRIEQTATGATILELVDLMGHMGRGTRIRFGVECKCLPGYWYEDTADQDVDKLRGLRKLVDYSDGSEPGDGVSRVVMKPDSKPMGSTTTIFFDYAHNTINDPKCTEPAIALGHEILHAIHLGRGEGLIKFDNTTNGEQTKMEEARAVGKNPYQFDTLSENQLRREFGKVFFNDEKHYPERTQYATQCGDRHG
ncbi:MAG TPA: M91 family zinc metallopeptidase, partial [Planctomycetota bacterium]|nr:M91 family zinc metallopeptidase [Planctomycetota bacterium]